MAKLANLLVILVLFVWLAGSGCVGNDASKAENTGVNPDVNETGDNSSENLTGLTTAEISELNSDMEDLDNLLENVSLGEDIEIEDVEIEKA
jgi:hypothetical protein